MQIISRYHTTSEVIVAAEKLLEEASKCAGKIDKFSDNITVAIAFL
jgi:hypothetical protein